jgi:hypothetical protein
LGGLSDYILRGVNGLRYIRFDQLSYYGPDLGVNVRLIRESMREYLISNSYNNVFRSFVEMQRGMNGGYNSVQENLVMQYLDRVLGNSLPNRDMYYRGGQMFCDIVQQRMPNGVMGSDVMSGSGPLFGQSINYEGSDYQGLLPQSIFQDVSLSNFFQIQDLVGDQVRSGQNNFGPISGRQIGRLLFGGEYGLSPSQDSIDRIGRLSLDVIDRGIMNSVRRDMGMPRIRGQGISQVLLDQVQPGLGDSVRQGRNPGFSIDIDIIC